MTRVAFLVALLALAGCENFQTDGQIDNINKEDIDAEIDKETTGIAL